RPGRVSAWIDRKPGGRPWPSHGSASHPYAVAADVGVRDGVEPLGGYGAAAGFAQAKGAVVEALQSCFDRLERSFAASDHRHGNVVGARVLVLSEAGEMEVAGLGET